MANKLYDAEAMSAEYDSIHSATAYSSFLGRGHQFGNYSTIRADFNRSDYEYYRQAERIPSRPEDSIKICDLAYRNVFILRSVIDMMADFTVQGIRITHRTKSKQNFLDAWAKKVDFYDVSERIANTLYRLANCPVKITYGKIPAKIEKDWNAAEAGDAVFKQEKTVRRRIPLRYNILHPKQIDIIGGDLSTFIGKPVYGLKIDHSIRQEILKIKNGGKSYLTDFLDIIPDDFMQKVIAGHSTVPLDPEKIEMLFYKKDDWCAWAWPIAHSILEQIYLLEKYHLADSKALDGAISQIRLWRLGDLEKNILPTPAGIAKLKNILANIGSGDVMDVVWGPELDFKESSSSAYNFLKSEKYDQVMREIFIALGLPSTLAGGSASQGQGFSNNAISMKTLVERLEYGRRILKSFWEKELKKIQKAFGWKYAPIIEFDYKVLSDDASERKFLIDLWDRNVISTEKINQLCRQDPRLEEMRVSREYKKIEKGKIPPKASPYHNAGQAEKDKAEILLNGGVKQKGEESPGRPLNTKDTVKRKQRVPKVRTSLSFIDLFNWASDAQDKINDILVPNVLKHYNKPSIRNLDKEEMAAFEELKFNVLCNISPYIDIDKDVVASCIKDIDSDLASYKLALIERYKETHEKSPTLTEIRQIQSSAYAIKYEQD